MRDLVKNFSNLTYKIYHILDANLNLWGIGSVEMSLHNLIGVNHINYDIQEWFFEKIMKNTKNETQKKKNIDKYTWPRRVESNITGTRD